MSIPLDGIRTRLDDVDQRIVTALAERAQLIKNVADLKRDGSSELPVRDVAREEDLLTRIVDLGRRAGLDERYLTGLYREILDHSLRLQQGLLSDSPGAEDDASVVVYQGREGSYSHLAGTRHFAARRGSFELRGLNSFRAILEAVRDGKAQYAVLPIENTIAGSINEAYDLLTQMDLALIGEEIQPVEHCLITLEPVPLTRIRRIYSQVPALAQCERFLSSLEHCQAESCTDTAMACIKIRDDQDLSQAAIASEEAAEIYGLHVMKRGIANSAHNQTRFAIVAQKPVRYDVRVACKTSLLLGTRHEPGALLQILSVLAQHGLNLSKLESRPRPETPWEYLFYIDFEGNVADPDVELALRELAGRCRFLKVLGSYPARTTTRAAAPKRTAAAPAPALAIPREAPGVVESLDKKPYRLASRAHRREDTIVRVGSVEVGGARPIVIAGPCAVETREQMMVCAREVKARGGDILRGGCFKPRTSPYAFQGLGLEGLELLAEAGREYGLPIVTEVLQPGEVGPVARLADVLQIGARNMQNFALLKEVGKVDKPVMLKRGLMASIDEWLSAAEYILSQGNQQVILCERGIRTFETATRNTLDLSAVPVLQERTHLPVLVDPSHACGTWRWITPLAKAAFAVGADGIMVEIHPKPEEALSDGPQALDFDRWSELMSALAR